MRIVWLWRFRYVIFWATTFVSIWTWSSFLCRVLWQTSRTHSTPFHSLQAEYFFTNLKKLFKKGCSPYIYLFDHNHLLYVIISIVLYWSEVTLLQVPVASWFDDMTDSELLDLIPFFEKLSKVDNVYTLLCNSNHPYNISTTSSMINQSPPPQQQHNNLQVNNHATLNAGS